MSVSTTSELDLLIQKATSESIPNGELDLPSAMEISDVVRSRRISPKDSMRCLKKRIMSTSSNPNTQLSSWKLTDICIKNGGIPFIKEICSREFMDTMEHTILKNQNNGELEELVIKLFYELYLAFRNDSQLSYVSRVYEKLLARGVEFPTSLSESNNSMAMFDSRTPADWVDSDACMICSKRFNLLNRRHHCRSCGGIFCQEHSSRRIVLSDLGIYEPVRVCDNCFEDYDLKKGSTGGKKKHHGKKRKSNNGDDYDEDEQLRKAIELSLRESKGSSEPIVPVIQRIKESVKVADKVDEEEDDPELKAAIEASLREVEEDKKKRETLYQQQQQLQTQRKDLPDPVRLQAIPSFDLTSGEEEDIHLFASLVERMKTQSATEILEDSQLQKLYQKVIGTRPKLNNALNDSIQKYNLLIDMNTKISDIMNIYDELLERQLNNISMSERYSVPQGPSDPYAYYQKESDPYQNNNNANNNQNYQQIPSHKRPVVQQQTSGEEQVIQPPAQQGNPAYTQPHVEPHLNQIKDIRMEIPADQDNGLNSPSEPPYPADEEEVILEDRRYSHVSATEANSMRAGSKISSPETGRKLSNGAPYPVEDDEHVSQPQEAITNFDFPTVPSRKVVQPSPSVSAPTEDLHEASQTEEKLLIEL